MPELEGAVGVVDAPASAPDASQPGTESGGGAQVSNDAPIDTAGVETDLSIETGAEQGADGAQPEAAKPDAEKPDAAKPTPAKGAIDPQLLKEALADPKFGPMVRTLDNQLRSFRGAFPTVAEAWAYKTEFPTLAEAKEAGEILDEHKNLIENLKSGDPAILSKELDLLGEESPEAVSQLMDVAFERAKKSDIEGYNRKATEIFNESLEYVLPNAQRLLNSGRIDRARYDEIVNAANVLYGVQTGRNIGDPKPEKTAEELRIEQGRKALQDESRKASDSKLNGLRDSAVKIASTKLRTRVESHLKKVAGSFLTESGMQSVIDAIGKAVEVQTGADDRFKNRFVRAVREGKSPEEIAAICEAKYSVLLPKIFETEVAKAKNAFKISSGNAQKRNAAAQQPEMSGTASSGAAKPSGPPNATYMNKHGLWDYLSNREIEAGDYSRLVKRIALAKIPHW